VTEVALEETPSTNEHALELARSGAAPHLTLVWARRQSKGRGRGGRAWQSAEGNVFFSMVLRPQPHWGDLNQIPILTAVATFAAIRPLVPKSREVTLKWPNDLLIDGAKVSGTLIESLAASRRTDVNSWSAAALVVGIGVNVAHHPSEGLMYPATSLQIAGSAADRDQIICALAETLIATLALWCDAGFMPIRTAYLEHAQGLGQRITIRVSPETQEPVSGVFEDIGEDGALFLRLDDGTVERLIAGDILLGAPTPGRARNA